MAPLLYMGDFLLYLNNTVTTFCTLISRVTHWKEMDFGVRSTEFSKVGHLRNIREMLLLLEVIYEKCTTLCLTFDKHSVN